MKIFESSFNECFFFSYFWIENRILTLLFQLQKPIRFDHTDHWNSEINRILIQYLASTAASVQPLLPKASDVRINIHGNNSTDSVNDGTSKSEQGRAEPNEAEWSRTVTKFSDYVSLKCFYTMSLKLHWHVVAFCFDIKGVKGFYFVIRLFGLIVLSGRCDNRELISNYFERRICPIGF